MPKLVDMDITEVSAVDKAANKRKFLIVKSEGGEPMEGDTNQPEEKSGGFLAKMAEKIKDIVKGDAQTFTQAVASTQLNDKFWIATDALRKAIRTTLEDQELKDDKKVENIALSLQQFSDFVLGLTGLALNTAAGTTVKKAGAKISAARMEKLKNAHSVLAEIITEADKEPPAGSEPPAGDGKPKAVKKDTGEEDPEMKLEEVATIVSEAVTKAMEPVTARLDKLEKGDTQDQKPAGTDVSKGAGEEKPADIAKTVTEAIAKAMEPVTARIETLEKARGIKKSIAGQDGGSTQVEKKESIFKGCF